MNYCLYKLRFSTALHAGQDMGASNLSSGKGTLHADTLFSALYIQALAQGSDGQLLQAFLQGEMLLSDLLPYYEGPDETGQDAEEYYLPKPFAHPVRRAHNLPGQTKDPKDFKRLQFIGASQFNNYVGYVKGENDFNASQHLKSFAPGAGGVRTCVTLQQDQPMPYHVGSFTFNTGYGLFFIAGTTSQQHADLLSQLLEALSHTGIGGKRTAGLGKFQVEDVVYLDAPYNAATQTLAAMLKEDAHTAYMAANVCLPKNEEIQQAVQEGAFALVRRGGFVQSPDYAPEPLKKKELYAFQAGSCFKTKFAGDVFDVSQNGAHPVYRCLKPLFLGVNL